MISIVGNGAIGNVLALQCADQQLCYRLLVRSEIPSQIVCHDQEKLTTLEPNILRIDDTAIYANSSQSSLQKVGTDPTSEVLILPLKSYQVVDALYALEHVLADNVCIVLLHNGMGPHEKIQDIFPNNPVIIATTSYGAYKPAADQLQVTGRGETQCGWLDSNRTDSQAKIVFEHLLPPCQWHNNITQVLWQKLAVNAVINPLTAINDIPNGELTQRQFAQQIVAICDEIATVMNASGLTVSAQQLQRRSQDVARATAANYSSMHQDIKLKRKTEIDDINGYVVRQAQKHNLTAPINQHLCDEIKKREAK